MKVRILGCAVAVCSLGIVLLLLAEFVFHFSMEYEVRAEFRELPDSDQELKDWLLNHPGVYIGFVQRDGNTVVLGWGHLQTYWWDPVTPNVRERFEQFGYKGSVQYREGKCFRDK